MEDFTFIEPAQVRVLVVPVGGIGPLFEKQLQALRTATNIRLVDVSPIPSKRFNPQQNSQNKIFLRFTTSYPDPDSAYLSDFEPFRRTLVVVGLALHDDYSDRATAELREKYPAAITHNCVFFKAPTAVSPRKDCFFMTGEAERIITSIETILCGVTHNFLVSLNEFASDNENITLRSPIASIDGTLLTRRIQQAQKRLSTSIKAPLNANQSLAPNKKDFKIKSLQKQSGRHAKIMGNFYLLAGCTSEAIQYFTDAIINTKKSEDYLWLASALEGLAVATLILQYLGHPYPAPNTMLSIALQLPKSRVYNAGLTQNRKSTESTASRQSNAYLSPRNSMASSASYAMSSLAGINADFGKYQPLEYVLLLCLRACHYYQQSTSDLEDCVPDIVYIDSLLRSIDFMQKSYLAGEDGLDIVMKGVLNGVEVSTSPETLSELVSRESIVQEIYRVFNLDLDKLEISQICRVYWKIISVYDSLGFHRRQGFVLRQFLSYLSQVSFQSETPENVHIDINATMLLLINQILRIYHVCESSKLQRSTTAEQISTWSVLQLRVLKVCFETAESIQNFELCSKIGVLILKSYLHCLTKEDQLSLKDKLNWFILNIHSDNSGITIPFPDPFLVRDVIFKPDTRELLLPFPADAEDKTDEPVFNPYAKKSASGMDMSRVLCVNDIVTLRILLQNCFCFDFSIQSIDILAADDFKVDIVQGHARVLGSDFSQSTSSGKAEFWKEGAVAVNNSQIFSSDNNRETLRIPAKSITTIEIQVKPLQVGALKIRQFLIGIDQFGPQTFSIVDKEKIPKSNKIKYHGLIGNPETNLLDEIILDLTGSDSCDRLLGETFELNVIPTQPLLSLIDNLINNGWLMLLEGERQKCHIDLCNTSNDKVNYLSFSPWDTSIETITSRLSAKVERIGAEDVHELEWQLMKRKALFITNKDEIAEKYSNISPGEVMKIKFDVFGKRAVKEMRLILEYGLKDETDIQKGFVKTLKVPFKVSVHRSIEVISCDVIPLLPASLDELPKSRTKGCARKHLEDLVDFLVKLKSREDDTKSFCLLVIDLRNCWRERLHANLKFQVTPSAEFQIGANIDSEHTTRFLIPVKRASQGVEFYSNPIPSLRGKQFIKNSDLTEEQEAQERLSFWLRCGILDNLSGEWTTVDCQQKRSGEIDMRRIRLTPSLIKALSQEPVLMLHQFSTQDDSKNIPRAMDNCYDLQSNTFYKLETTITNNTTQPISGMVRYVPIPVNAVTKRDLSIEKKILYTGVLQRHIGANPIEPGKSTTISLGFLILEKGSYEWGCIFDPNANAASTIDREPLYLQVK
ncbi:hypothetical protein PUMCH_004285 [Australozyma saopauloensis]|uniref:Uncharacterized protein n=1 Tax=Australozyma saopauloensis TaxID=291208 RepID=A0AAX4HFA6_9ASCO|nr:hypothetical protein PUMCH_004285 [[Candida] saopauloensis]